MKKVQACPTFVARYAAHFTASLPALYFTILVKVSQYFGEAGLSLYLVTVCVAVLAWGKRSDYHDDLS